MLGLMLAAAASLAIWLALGRSQIMWRAILTTLGASIAGLAFCIVSGEFELEWLGLIWIVIVITAAIFLCLRHLGFRLVGGSTDIHALSKESQFSLSQLMLLTAIFAGLAAVARYLAPSAATQEALFAGISIAACVGIVAIACVWAIMNQQITRARLTLLAAVTLAMSLLVYFAMEITEADPGFVWATVIITYAGGLAGVMFVARKRGFRLLAPNTVQADATEQ